MTDEAKALVGRLRTKYCCSDWDKGCNCEASADLIETQAREIERLGVIAQGNASIVCKILDEKDAEIERLRGIVRGLIALVIDAGLTDDLVAQLYPDAKRKNGQPACEFAKRVRREVNEARAALAGDNHD